MQADPACILSCAGVPWSLAAERIHCNWLTPPEAVWYCCRTLPDSLLRGAARGAESEQIWLAAFKIEFENAEMERARGILAKARATLANERIWMKSALVERERGETAEARPLMSHTQPDMCARPCCAEAKN